MLEKSATVSTKGTTYSSIGEDDGALKSCLEAEEASGVSDFKGIPKATFKALFHSAGPWTKT